MNTDFCVFAFVLGCLVFGAGWVTRGWSDEQTREPEARRIIPRATPAGILGCPVTRERIIEHEIACRARLRSTLTKGKP